MPTKNRPLKKISKVRSDVYNCNVQSLLRLKHQASPSMSKEEKDMLVIDLTLKELFNDGDRKVVDLKKNVLDKYQLHYDNRTFERYWDLLDATNLVNPVVGFGNTNKLSLNTDGYNLMLKFGSYKNFLRTMNPQAQIGGPQKQQAAKPSPPKADDQQTEEYYKEPEA